MTRTLKQQQHFPFKLYVMLEYAGESEYASSVSWVEEGRAFAIRNNEKFMEHVVPRFFNQTKFRSFTRQLNLWGFTRISDVGPGSRAWKHEHFLRGRIDRLSSIERTESKKSNSKAAKTESHPQSNKIVSNQRRAATTVSTIQNAGRDVTRVITPVRRCTVEFEDEVAISVPEMTMHAPPTNNILPNASIQPLVPNNEFISHIWPTPLHPCPLLPSSTFPMNTGSTVVNSSSMNISQLPLLSSSHETCMAEVQPHVMGGTNEDDILFFLSGIVGSDESSNSGDLLYTSSLDLDEVSEDFMHPIRF
mmetsp:Transcript_28821/g.54461  ORF Transcript_28821/g.54461 Transcript_28821/m.54461 type:complete len:305 (-) Transcript_28821:601-1515(-)|eukprot:CAMPEP_0201662246 /NCGR_PEP_ID=MMETSP0494-20130426/4395_1 /ASSEMBLY_ACC=CAM_ASM_000839 /TAXON_ID=420259 /ORGANISM="Thalassiosira gravida, Strain GMp14c1" /LENGTH=304 /DNA_ID=CAMNT_0048140569 /DNA_START=185 /DNA_END=1099 /DNA_ORIENTATION=+